MNISIDRLLDILEEFENEWYEKHSSVWTDLHYDEYRKAKEEYLREYEREMVEREQESIVEYENSLETQFNEGTFLESRSTKGGKND